MQVLSAILYAKSSALFSLLLLCLWHNIIRREYEENTPLFYFPIVAFHCINILSTYWKFRYIDGLHDYLKKLYPLSHSSSSNSSQSHIHIYFPQDINYGELVPLSLTYLVMFGYIYFSVRKMEGIKSRVSKIVYILRPSSKFHLRIVKNLRKDLLIRAPVFNEKYVTNGWFELSLDIGYLWKCIYRFSWRLVPSWRCSHLYVWP